MEKLYEYTLRRQGAELTALRARVASLEATSTSSSAALAIAHRDRQPRHVANNTMNVAAVANVATVANVAAVTNVDASQGKTNNNVVTTMINVFGKENLGRVTKPKIFSILKSLGEVGSAGENLRTICDRAILQTAMIIFSDPEHPEDITCYIPNKKGESALVHGERGWEVQPVSLVISPMASQAVEALFKYQPVPEGDMPQQDVKWVMGECGRILRYLADHEGSLVNEPMRGELRGILIRNKDLLAQVLARLPMAGEA